jgi:hypothetical protein
MSLALDASPHPVVNPLRHDWTREDVRTLFTLPFPDLIFRAAKVHRENFDPAEVQISTLLSIKTGGCPEDCAYCPQSAKFDTGVKAEKLMDLGAVLAEARHDRVRRFAHLDLVGRHQPHDDRHRIEVERFLEQYGHRGRYESDWALPRLHEDPASALFAIRAHLQGEPQDTAATARRQEAAAAAALREFEGCLTMWQRVTLLPRVRWMLRGLKQQYLWREQVRSDLTRVVSRERCVCGRTALRIDRLRGRADDMVIFKGVNFYPRQLEQLLLRHPSLDHEYQMRSSEAPLLKRLPSEYMADLGLCVLPLAKRVADVGKPA